MNNKMNTHPQNMSLLQLKEMVVRAAAKSKEGHIPSGISILDILWIIYQRMNFKSNNPHDPDNDRFVLSKGHGSLGLYAVLIGKGLLDESELGQFCSFNAKLGGHPDRNKIPWVEASTGSLGHGLPIALGMAMGNKIQGIPSNIYTLIGDGECNEGTIWESALLAAHHKLDNLCCFVDYNHSTDRALRIDDLSKKFNSFGWHVINVNGHDQAELNSALDQFTSIGKPTVIIAETVKGFGIPSMENQPAWHHKSPSSEVEIINIIKEIYEKD